MWGQKTGSICWELCTADSWAAWLHVRGSSCVVRLMRLCIEDCRWVTEMIYASRMDGQLGGNIRLTAEPLSQTQRRRAYMHVKHTHTVAGSHAQFWSDSQQFYTITRDHVERLKASWPLFSGRLSVERGFSINDGFSCIINVAWTTLSRYSLQHWHVGDLSGWKGILVSCYNCLICCHVSRSQQSLIFVA